MPVNIYSKRVGINRCYVIKADGCITPGHTPGSISVLLDTGDAFAGCMTHNNPPFRLKPGLPIFAEDLPRLKESWKRLLEEGVKTIYPGHGNPFAAEEMRKAL